MTDANAIQRALNTFFDPFADDVSDEAKMRKVLADFRDERIEELEKCCAAHQEDVDGWVDEQARLIREREAAEAEIKRLRYSIILGPTESEVALDAKVERVRQVFTRYRKDGDYLALEDGLAEALNDEDDA